jgi:hypothetical protein
MTNYAILTFNIMFPGNFETQMNILIVAGYKLIHVIRAGEGVVQYVFEKELDLDEQEALVKRLKAQAAEIDDD